MGEGGYPLLSLPGLNHSQECLVYIPHRRNRFEGSFEARRRLSYSITDSDRQMPEQHTKAYYRNRTAGSLARGHPEPLQILRSKSLKNYPPSVSPLDETDDAHPTIKVAHFSVIFFRDGRGLLNPNLFAMLFSVLYCGDFRMSMPLWDVYIAGSPFILQLIG